MEGSMPARRHVMDFVFADARLRSADIPVSAELKMRLVINHDNSWALDVERYGDTYNLVLSGNEETSALALLMQLVDYVSGPPH